MERVHSERGGHIGQGDLPQMEFDERNDEKMFAERRWSSLLSAGRVIQPNSPIFLI